MTTIWDYINSDTKLIDYLQTCDRNSLCSYHSHFNITILQWLLWYIGSGIRAYTIKKKNNYSRKDWAFYKIEIIKSSLTKVLWKKLVHMPSGFSDKCSTIHFFTRNAYTVDNKHLAMINNWLDECNGRFKYAYVRDEYGYKPGEYVNFHRIRQEKFRNHIKTDVDNLTNIYHRLENQIKNIWINNNLDFFDWLKEIATCSLDIDDKKIYIESDKIKGKILEAGKARIDSHILHDKLFGSDELSKIEKLEEKKGHGLSQMTNHLWIVNMYLVVLKNTAEGKSLAEYMENI